MLIYSEVIEAAAAVMDAVQVFFRFDKKDWLGRNFFPRQNLDIKTMIPTDRLKVVNSQKTKAWDIFKW